MAAALAGCRVSGNADQKGTHSLKGICSEWPMVVEELMHDRAASPLIVNGLWWLRS